MDTVGRNKKQVAEYIQNQLREDQIADQVDLHLVGVLELVDHDHLKATLRRLHVG